jgi:chitinase
VLVRNINDPPVLLCPRASTEILWPPNHNMVKVSIRGVVDVNRNSTVTITRVAQDEPTKGLGDGDTAIDAMINADGTVLLRAERSSKGNGRVYHVHFTASDREGSVSGMVKVSVPRDRICDNAIDGGELFDSTR